MALAACNTQHENICSTRDTVKNAGRRMTCLGMLWVAPQCTCVWCVQYGLCVHHAALAGPVVSLSCSPEEAVCLGVQLIEGVHVSKTRCSEPVHTACAAAQSDVVMQHRHNSSNNLSNGQDDHQTLLTPKCAALHYNSFICCAPGARVCKADGSPSQWGAGLVCTHICGTLLTSPPASCSTWPNTLQLSRAELAP